MKDKLALFCDIDKDAVIQNRTLDSIYEVPLLLAEEGLDRIVLDKLALEDRPCDMEDWKRWSMIFIIRKKNWKLPWSVNM